MVVRTWSAEAESRGRNLSRRVRTRTGVSPGSDHLHFEIGKQGACVLAGVRDGSFYRIKSELRMWFDSKVSVTRGQIDGCWIAHER